MLLNLLATACYRAKRVEYIRFYPNQRNWWREFLILYCESRVPIIASHCEVVRTAIKFQEKLIFKKQLERFRQMGIQIETRNISLVEFSQVAKVHSLLKKDPWVKECLPEVLEAERLSNTR